MLKRLFEGKLRRNSRVNRRQRRTALGVQQLESRRLFAADAFSANADPMPSVEGPGDVAAEIVTVEDLDGGEGNDLLIGGDGVDGNYGGAGQDFLLGSRGNDVVPGQDGSDLLIVNNGDGSDFSEGGDGNDTVQVNGAGDSFRVDPNGERVMFQRNNLGLFTLDIGTTENLDVNGQGGSDIIIGATGLNG